MEINTVVCPACGKSFKANASITEITCNFCRTVFNSTPIRGELLEAQESETDSVYFFNKAVMALTPKVTTALNKSDVLAKQKYPQYFSDYYNEICHSYKCFEKAYSLYVGDKKEIVLQYAEAFASKIKKNAGKENLNSLNGLELEGVIYLYILFAVPSILKYEAEYSDALADALLQTWNREHKKRKIGKSTFEAINQGFKFKLCFITTAVCDTLGRPDDCYELNSFRKFRDNYLLKQPGGKAQVQEYYLIAPLIVNAIYASPDKNRVYYDIWDNYLSKCLAMYEQGKYEQCRKTYTEMVSFLREKWL